MPTPIPRTALLPAELLLVLACPRDHAPLTVEGTRLCCEHGHTYPIVEGVPVFLLPELDATIGIARDSLRAAESGEGGPLYLQTLGLSPQEKQGVEAQWRAGSTLDPAVSHLVGATSGHAYVDRIGRLSEYPIPDIPVAAGGGDYLLDVGCSWGRWSVSAARKQWRAIGIDPSLGAVLAAKRAFDGLGLPLWFVCGDARALPFKPGAFGCVYSYSVLQHFSEADCERAVAECGRVLRPAGSARIQMAQKWGLRSTYHRTRPGYLDSGVFRVRYWSPPALQRLFERAVGPARVESEAFGGLGLLQEDRRFYSRLGKLLVTGSTVLRAVARVVRPLRWLADSVFVTATKR